MRLRVAALARSLAFAAITLPFTSPSGVAAIEPETTQQYLDKADALLSSGKYQEALGWYDQAVQKDDSNYLSYFKRATTRLSLGKTSGALDDFAKILQIKPDFDQALYQRAKIYTKEGQYTDAINELDKYLRNNKNDPSAKELVSNLHSAFGMVNQFRKARSLHHNRLLSKLRKHLTASPLTSVSSMHRKSLICRRIWCKLGAFVHRAILELDVLRMPSATFLGPPT